MSTITTEPAASARPLPEYATLVTVFIGTLVTFGTGRALSPLLPRARDRVAAE